MIVPEETLKVLLGISSSITDEEQAFLSIIHPRVEGAVKKYLQYDPEQKSHTEMFPRHLRSGGPGHNDTDGTWDIVGDNAVWYSSTGQNTLQLTHLPIRLVTSVHVDTSARHGDATDPFADSMLWTAGEDYWTDWDQDDVCYSGQLHSYGSWPSTPGTVKVVYRAGYSALEFDGDVTTSSVVGDVITTADVDGSGISAAVQSTVVAAFVRAMALKKKSFGFTPGALISEKLGDYSYTVDKATYSPGGFAVALPDDAKQLLDPYRHWGLARL